METVFFWYNEEDNLVYPTQHQVFLTKKQLENIIDSCEMTLCYYDANNISEEDIIAKNEKYLDEKYFKLFNQERVIKKTNVYLMIDENTGYHKIGRSINPTKRERTLQSEKPTIKLLYSCEVPLKIETILHEKYKKYRLRGEWFDLDEGQINEIVEYLESKRIICQGGTKK
jgi:hypothetical protein